MLEQARIEIVQLTPDQLSTIGKRVRDNLRIGAKARYEAGKDLHLVKQALDHGQYEAWLGREFPLSIRTAQRYVESYLHIERAYQELIDQAFISDPVFDIPLDVLDDPADVFTVEPTSVQGKADLQNAVIVVNELASERIRQKVESGYIGVVSAGVSITKAPENVRNAAKQWNVAEIGVIDILGRLAETLPDEFDGVAQSGVMQFPDIEIEGKTTAGKAFKLDEITTDQAKEIYKALRREAGIIEHEANSLQPILDQKARVVRTVKHELNGRTRITFELDVSETVFKKLQALVALDRRLVIKNK